MIFQSPWSMQITAHPLKGSMQEKQADWWYHSKMTSASTTWAIPIYSVTCSFMVSCTSPILLPYRSVITIPWARKKHLSRVIRSTSTMTFQYIIEHFFLLQVIRKSLNLLQANTLKQKCCCRNREKSSSADQAVPHSS